MSSDSDLEGNYYLPDGILNFGEPHFIIQVYYVPDLVYSEKCKFGIYLMEVFWAFWF